MKRADQNRAKEKNQCPIFPYDGRFGEFSCILLIFDQFSAILQVFQGLLGVILRFTHCYQCILLEYKLCGQHKRFKGMCSSKISFQGYFRYTDPPNFSFLACFLPISSCVSDCGTQITLISTSGVVDNSCRPNQGKREDLVSDISL